MLENIDSYLIAQQAPMKLALVELVRIPSVCEEGGGGYPFGEAIDQVLCKALQIAGELGFRTHYGNQGYCWSIKILIGWRPSTCPWIIP